MATSRSRFLLATLAAALWAAAPATAAEEELEPSDPPAPSAPAPGTSVEIAPAVTPVVPLATPPDTAKAAAAPADTSLPAPAAPAAAKSDSAAPVQAAAAAEGPAPDELTIEVDKDQSKNEGKSLPLALLYSAALPGSGELYLEEKGAAKAFLLAEAGFWASLYVAWMAKASYLQSARNHASEYAGIDASGKGESFLESMAAYRTYQEKEHRGDSYEFSQIIAGKREQDYGIKPIPENFWDFGSSVEPSNTRAWKDFQGTMRYYRASKVAMSFALGALALNRLASLVNTLQTYKRTSAKRVGWDLTPDLGPDYAGSRLTLRF